jgi:hypothetical protein
VFAAPAAQAAGPVAHAAACEKRVTFGLIDARTDGCLNKVSTSPDKWESTDTVRLNGLPLPVVSGSKLVLTGPSGSSGGNISVNTNFSIAGIPINQGVFNVDFPAGNPGEQKDFKSFATKPGLKLKGFDISGSIAIQIGRDAGGEQPGYTRIQFVVALPSIFKNGPGQSAGGLTGTVAVRADQNGVHADTLKLEVANAYVGQVLLKNVCLSYLSASSMASPCQPPSFGATKLLNCTEASGVSRWDGSALITIPTAARPDVGLFAGVQDGQFAYAGAQVTNLGNSVPLVQGVYLDKVGLGICLRPPPLKVKGAVGLRFGPDFKGKQAAYLDGSIEYIDSRPWVIDARGSLALFGNNVANGYITYKSSGAVDFGFNANFNFAGGLLTVNAGVNGWYQPARTDMREEFDLRTPQAQRDYRDAQAALQATRQFGFIRIPAPDIATFQRLIRQVPKHQVPFGVPSAFDVFGNGRVCAAKIVCASGEVAVSSVGVAGCASITVAGYPEPYWLGVRWRSVSVRAGAGYRWGGGVSTMGSSCDVGPYRATRSVAHTAGGDTLFVIHGPRGGAITSPAAVVRVAGRGAPPKVILTGPGGRTIRATGAGILHRGTFSYVENPSDNSTEIVITRPEPGTWRIHGIPGSSPIVSISQAPVVVPPVGGGRVLLHGGGAGVHILEYAIDRVPNHELVLWERGSNYEQQLGPVVGRPCMAHAPVRGKRPADALQGRPKIICGALPFKSAPGPGGERHIIAVETENGVPIREISIAHYKAPGEKPPHQVHNLHVKRSGSTAIVSWTPSPRTFDYDIDVRMSDGESRLRTVGPNVHQVVLTNIDPGLSLDVQVRALLENNMQSRLADAKSPGAIGNTNLQPATEPGPQDTAPVGR